MRFDEGAVLRLSSPRWFFGGITTGLLLRQSVGFTPYAKLRWKHADRKHGKHFIHLETPPDRHCTFSTKKLMELLYTLREYVGVSYL
jgi:hypothetical protein